MQVRLRLPSLSLIILAAGLQAVDAQPLEPKYAPPDEKQWNDMARFFWGLNMPGDAHKAIQEYLQQVQRESQMRETRKQLGEKK